MIIRKNMTQLDDVQVALRNIALNSKNNRTKPLPDPLILMPNDYEMLLRAVQDSGVWS
jgi:hypothetical protein